MSSLLNLALNDDQEMLRDTVSRLLRDQSPPQRVRAAESTGFDPELWQSVCELGLPMMRTSEAAGGSDLSLLDLAIVCDSLGATLASVPLLETIVAARLLSQLDSQAAPWLAEIASGAPAAVCLQPVSPGGQVVVPGIGAAKFVLALIGGRLMAVRNLEIATAANWTVASPLGLWTVPAESEAVVLAEGEAALAAWQSALEEWKIGAAAQMAGIALEALRLAAEYANERVQFGRKIGSFQGIAHPLADAATDAEGARLMVWQAISATASGSTDAAAHISMAFWWASQAVETATRRAVRTFGGYGVSLENDIQLFFRRGKAVSLVLGDPERELQRVGDRLWGEEPTTLPDAGNVGIEFGWGTEAEAYADRLRTFLADNVDAELRRKIHHSTKAHSKPFAQKLAKAGLLYPHLPVAAGGEGRSPIEVAAADALWEGMDWNRTASGVTEFVLQIELRFGTPEAKAEIAPRMIAGEAVGCLGFSEPGSGSDIFACSFRATRDGDEWVLNGQKMFTTGGHIADYILLLTRTDTSGAKHQGLTVFVLPMTMPGIEIQPVHTLQDERTNITFFQDVRIPDRYRLGEVGGGMQVMHMALELEHGGIVYHYALPVMLRHAVAWAQETDANGRRPIDEATVKRRLARAAVLTAVSEGISRRDVWAQASGKGEIAFGPMSKLFSTEAFTTAAADLVALAAPASLLQRSDDLAFVEVGMRRGLAMTIYGGTSEIQRSLIAEHFLKLPKSRS